MLLSRIFMPDKNNESVSSIICFDSVVIFGVTMFAKSNVEPTKTKQMHIVYLP